MPIPSDFSLRLSADEGSVPPEHQGGVILTLDAAGDGTIQEWSGQDRGAPTPVHLGPAALAALHDDLVAFGLFSTDWAEPDGPITPGGPGLWITATHSGIDVRIPSRVRDDQRDARERIVRRLEAAVGCSLTH